MRFTDLMDMPPLFFLGLTEPEPNRLRLHFARAKTVTEPLVLGEKVLENAQTPVIDVELPVLQVDFDSYVGYSVRDESFTARDPEEEWQGRAFRVYTKSRYLDFIEAGTFADEFDPGPFKHYGITCFDHIVDVVSASEPVVSEVAHFK